MITVPVLKELEFSLFPSTLNNYKGKIDSTIEFLHQNHRAQICSKKQQSGSCPPSKAELP